MRIGAVWLVNANANYRAIDPLRAMERRGHEVLWPDDPEANPEVRRLATCDVVHVYRRADDEIRPLLTQLTRGGTPFTYDNDDDFTSTPKQSPGYRDVGGLRGQRYFAATVKVARMARAASTTTERLAAKYRDAGVERVEVIPNQLSPDLPRPRNSHPGIVIGWVAALEHRVDVDRLKLGEVLARLLERHPDVRVECIGVNLGLSERYRHDASVAFEDLPRRIAGFDVGIAPLADIPWNWARSDIKVKEYAAAGVPWLASPIGPYRDLGEDQGGRLVPDDGWLEALERLVPHRRERKRLARRGKAWAKRQTIEAVADRWESLLTAAATGTGTGAGDRAGAGAGTPG
jgi:glycosyltransferase involved in cell wall biosynthesis